MEGFIFLPLFFLVLVHVPCLIHADDVCADKDCGQGTCVPKSSSILGFDCVCFKGWKQFQIGPLIFPSCVIPNCTVNLQCGGNAPPSPPTPAPPLINPFSPCNFVWCGDGTCVVNGTGHYCQCNEGSNNLLNLTDAACFKKCSFGKDCGVLGFGDGPLLTPPPPALLPPPPPSLPPPSARPPSNGSNTISKNSGSYDGLSLLLLSGVISAFFL